MKLDSQRKLRRSDSIRTRWRRAAWLSSAVVESRRFLARELVPGKRVASYRLRELPLAVPMRHGQHEGAGSQDAFVLHEVFRSGIYEPPPEVSAALDSVAEGPRVVDLGANLGFFSLFALARHPHARITAFEPDPANARLLRETLRRNGFAERVEVVEACAHTGDGWVTFADGLGCRSHIVPAGEDGVSTPAVDVFRFLEDIDLLKMDIEGGEWPLLADERLASARPRAIVLEYHSFGCPSSNAKREASERLAHLGYVVHHPQPERLPDSGPFWGSGVLWAWLATPAAG